MFIPTSHMQAQGYQAVPPPARSDPVWHCWALTSLEMLCGDGILYPDDPGSRCKAPNGKPSHPVSRVGA